MVITIIFILLTFIAPVVGTVTENARQTICMNNLKRIGVAAFSYSEEYDQYVMPGKFQWTKNIGNYNHWINYMAAELISDPEVFRCPSMGDEDTFNPAGGGVNSSVFDASYIMNIIEPGQWAGATISTPKGKSWGWGSTKIPLRVQEVRNPSEKIYIMDVIEGGVNWNHSGIRRFSETDHGIINLVPLANFRRVGFHHRLGFNVLMGDGHTEFMSSTNHDQWVVTVK